MPGPVSLSLRGECLPCTSSPQGHEQLLLPIFVGFALTASPSEWASGGGRCASSGSGKVVLGPPWAWCWRASAGPRGAAGRGVGVMRPAVVQLVLGAGHCRQGRSLCNRPQRKMWAWPQVGHTRATASGPGVHSTALRCRSVSSPQPRQAGWDDLPCHHASSRCPGCRPRQTEYRSVSTPEYPFPPGAGGRAGPPGTAQRRLGR